MTDGTGRDDSHMAITVHLDELMRMKKITVTDLAKKVGISRVNMSNLKAGKVKAIRFSTLEALCKELDCQPGDIIRYEEDE